MFYETKRAKSKLSDRLTTVYTLLFTVVLLLLSIGIFLTAFQFLLKKQASALAITAELISDHLIEEIEEDESLSNQEILEEQNNDPLLSIFIYDASGKLINRLLNFPLEESSLPSSAPSPVMVLVDGNMLLCSTREIQEHGTTFGTLYLVQNLQSESTFLKLLGILLIGANLLGVLAAVIVGHFTSRRMLAPVKHMIEATRQISGSNLDLRLDVPEPDDELKSLALTINGMLDRMSAAYHQQGRFVADVSHELRTPLAVVQGNVDLLARWGSKDEAIRDDSILALQKQTDYMNHLVENLLFLARFDNMQSQLNPTTFFVDELFSDLVEEQALIDPDHQYIVYVPAKDGSLFADRLMIKQLLRALIDNSVKYTPHGGTIRLAYEPADDRAVLIVSDDGIGMDPEHCDHIFERFYRVDQARARATGGMGLGLSIVSAIAQAHGGSAYVNSESGSGTTVTVVLPK